MHKISCIIPHTGNVSELDLIYDRFPVASGVDLIFILDGPVEELEVIKNRYSFGLHLCTGERKLGAGVARNIGIKHSTGDYIIFHDADDYVDWLEILTIVSEAEPDIDILLAYPAAIKSDGSESKRNLRYVQCLKDYNLSNDVSDIFGMVVPWSKIIRKRLLLENNILFDEVIASNDVMFSIKCFHYAATIKVVDKEFYTVVEHENSLTRNENLERAKTRLEVSFRANNYLRRHGYKKRFVIIGRLYTLFKFSIPFGLKCLADAIKQKQPFIIEWRHVRNFLNLFIKRSNS